MFKKPDTVDSVLDGFTTISKKLQGIAARELEQAIIEEKDADDLLTKAHQRRNEAQRATAASLKIGEFLPPTDVIYAGPWGTTDASNV